MKNLDKVVEGIINQVKDDLNMLSEEEQAEIVRRRVICETCPFNSKNAVKDGYTTDRIDDHCIMCGCTITRKTASLSSSCGIGNCNPDNDADCKKKGLKEFNKEHNIKMVLKWEAFKN